jgi:hypothetical protein
MHKMEQTLLIDLRDFGECWQEVWILYLWVGSAHEKTCGPFLMSKTFNSVGFPMGPLDCLI